VSHPRSVNGIAKTCWRALVLDVDLYAEAFQGYTLHRAAQTMVGIAACSHAIGSSMILLTYNTSLVMQILALLANIAVVVVGYYSWKLAIWKIGAWLQTSMPPYKRLLIPIGLVYTPQILNFFTVVPLLGRPIEIGLALWSLVAAIVALYNGLNLKLSKAIAICTLGWVVVQVAIGMIQIGIQRILE
jgi:hypothetical protein